MNVKGIELGSGRPVICVSVTERTKEAVLNKIKALVKKEVLMIEWRVDYFEDLEQEKEVAELLKEASPYLCDTLFLFTFRSRRQGGEADLTEEEQKKLQRTAALAGCVDFIDLEFLEQKRPLEWIKTLHGMGKRVIASHHDFEETPPEEVMNTLLSGMKAAGADLVKLAVMPKSNDDVLSLLRVTDQFRKRFNGTPAITMSMGKYGVISRIAGESFGSCVTFGADGNASAPGQLQLEKLEQILDTLHEAMEN